MNNFKKILDEKKVGVPEYVCTKCDWTGDSDKLHTDRGGHNFLCPKCKAMVKTNPKLRESINEDHSDKVRLFKKLQAAIEKLREAAYEITECYDSDEEDLNMIQPVKQTRAVFPKSIDEWASDIDDLADAWDRIIAKESRK